MVDIEFWGWLIGCGLGLVIIAFCEYVGRFLAKTFHD